MRLMQLHAVMRQMQAPGPGASNPSRSGITMASLIQAIPGGRSAHEWFRDAVAAPRAAREQLEIAGRPEVAVPTLRSMGAGAAYMDPQSFWLSAGAGSASARHQQDKERRELEGAPYYGY